jgi:hypothetical protein
VHGFANPVGLGHYLDREVKPVIFSGRGMVGTPFEWPSLFDEGEAFLSGSVPI